MVRRALRLRLTGLAATSRSTAAVAAVARGPAAAASGIAAAAAVSLL
jgi:hypothetical protein